MIPLTLEDLEKTRKVAQQKCLFLNVLGLPVFPLITLYDLFLLYRAKKCKKEILKIFGLLPEQVNTYPLLLKEIILETIKEEDVYFKHMFTKNASMFTGLIFPPYTIYVIKIRQYIEDCYSVCRKVIQKLDKLGLADEKKNSVTA